jgi:hypothetical protein
VQLRGTPPNRPLLHGEEHRVLQHSLRVISSPDTAVAAPILPLQLQLLCEAKVADLHDEAEPRIASIMRTIISKRD